MATYTVKSGDCLWNIAQSKLGNPYRWTEIADLNGISRSNPIIHPGDVLTLPGSSGGSSTGSNRNTSNKARIEYLGLQAGTDRTLYVTWSWSRTSTKSYKVSWYYSTGNNIWFTGATNNNEVDSNHPSDSRQSTYTAPSNAYKVKVIVRPIAKTGKVNNKETLKWTASDSTAKYYSFSNAPNPPGTPSAPTVTIDKLKLTATLDDIDSNTTKMMFEVTKDNNKVFNTSGKLSVKTNHVEYTCSINAGSEYKVRCKGYNKNDSSEWGPYSSNMATIPAVPTEFETCKANSETSVYLEGGAVATATSYDIEYTTEKRYFDGSDGTTTVTGITTTQYEKTGLEGDLNTGILYADMGDIEYFISGDMDAALKNYEHSVLNKNSTPTVNYRIGVINYNKQNYENALTFFIKALEKKDADQNLLLAAGNTLALRGDNFAAQGYYNRLLSLLNEEKAHHALLFPQAKEEDSQLVEMILKTNNNLGVVLNKIARQTGNSQMNGKSFECFVESIRAWDALTRNQETMVRLGGSNLALQNSKYISASMAEFEPAIYTDIPRTLVGEKVLK